MSGHLPGAASMVAQLDKRVLLILRDGRHVVGMLRSLDGYANFVLEEAHERHYAGNKYGDVYIGLYVVRGENVALVGELDEVADDAGSGRLAKVPADEILEEEATEEGRQASEAVTRTWDFSRPSQS